MNVTPLFLLVCHLLSAKVRGESSIRGTQKEEQHTVGKLQEQSVVCMVEQVDVKFSNYEPSPSNDAESTASDSDSAFLCVTDQDNAADQSFVIDLPPLVLENITHHEHPVLSISDAVLDNEAVQLSVIKDASIDIDDSPSQHRSLASATGTGQVLVLRITYRGISPSLSADQLASRVFGLGNNPERHSLSSQIDACSFRQLQLRPAEGDDIVNGIAEISINKRVAGSNSVLALDNLVVANATRRFGRLSTQFAHVLFVFPSAGLLFGGRGWLAYAYFNGWRSVYNDKWGGSLSALMHEVGHNLNLNHAGRGSQNYGDVTGYMGWGTSKIGAPTSCFNAQKSWALGWYKDRSLSLSLPDFPWGGQVAFFGEYDKTTPDQPVILSLEDGSKRFFLQYNRAKGMNEQTREFPNQVVLVSDEGPGDGRWGPQSRLEGAIGLNEQSTRRNFRIQNFEASGFPLFIRVCDEVEGPPDLVRLSIHLEDGTQSDTCNLNIEASAQTTPCDDDFSAVFFVDPNRGYKDCGWLARVMAKSDFWSEALCQEGHEAYNACAETCGKCTDKCEDTTGAFFYVNARHGNKDCEWLSTRTPWREKLCHEGNAAYAYCQESCNVCD